MSAGAPQAIDSRGLTRLFGSVLANAGVNLWAAPLRWRMPVATFET
jgi:hypothetical protein